jgi:hypothetical protein
MEAGSDYSVKFSRQTSGEDYVAADAVKVKKVSEAPLPEKPPIATDQRRPPKEHRCQAGVARTW